MIPALTYAFYALCVAYTLWAVVTTVRGVPAGKWLILSTGALEVLLVVQGVLALVLWGRHDGTDALLFFGYLLTAVVLVPLAGAWAWAELSRWGPAVLAAAGITVFVMIERMDQIWV
ncbi:hypothetical protein [Brevibacterium litoralis]|uniref:hypothetical protein n=1 Tax=Brevibacterium litoralis TaxID=3138935 RepID=UPI0032ED9172